MVDKRSLKKGKTNIEIYGIEKANIIRKKLSNSHKGQVPTNIEQLRKINTGKKYVKGNKFRLGKNHSQNTRDKISKAKKGKSPAWNKGLRGFNSGEKNNMWRGGITPIHNNIRNSADYKEWRKSIFERDIYTCQKCGKVGGYLEVHHKIPFREILKEFRIRTFKQALKCPILWDIDNGITYCTKCHKEEDKYRR